MFGCLQTCSFTLGVSLSGPMCRVLLAQFAEWVCANHKFDDRARRLVDKMHTHMLISMNPDGFAKHSRENG